LSIDPAEFPQSLAGFIEVGVRGGGGEKADPRAGTRRLRLDGERPGEEAEEEKAASWATSRCPRSYGGRRRASTVLGRRRAIIKR
jgi:hypothetical protein